MKIPILAFTACLFFTGTAQFCQGVGFYLDGLLREARENNPDILAAKRRWETALVRTPDVELFNKNEPGSKIFPFLAKLSLKEKIAVIEAQMYACEYKETQAEILEEVRGVFFDLFLNVREIEAYEESLRFWEGLSGKNNSLRLSEENALKIEIEVAAIKNRLLKLKEEKASREEKINILVHKKYDRGIPFLKEVSDMPVQLSVLRRLALENSQELIALSYAIEKNRLAFSDTGNNFIPGLISEVNLKGIALGKVGTWDFMLALDFPFWVWAKQRYGFKEAINTLEEARLAYETMRRNVSIEIEDTAQSIKKAQGNVKFYRENVLPRLYALLNSATLDFQKTKANLNNLLERERATREAKIDYCKAQVEYNMYLSDLEFMLGPEERRKT